MITVLFGDLARFRSLLTMIERTPASQLQGCTHILLYHFRSRGSLAGFRLRGLSR